MMTTNWYVITGGPSSGKTSLINHLARLQFQIAPEIARDYINRLIAEHHTLDDLIHSNSQLQRTIFAGVLKRERLLSKEQLIFFDRGTPDSIGYFRYYRLDTKKAVHNCQHIRYKKVFYCHQLPMEYDSIRVEDNSSAKQIGDFIRDAYKNLGYELIELPAVSIKRRLEIIATHLEK